jgi:hypothetical protein
MRQRLAFGSMVMAKPFTTRPRPHRAPSRVTGSSAVARWSLEKASRSVWDRRCSYGPKHG